MDTETPCTFIQVTKDQASSFGIGQEVSFVVSGEVKSIEENDNSYGVELKHTSVSVGDKAASEVNTKSDSQNITGHGNTPADHELERMLG